jgi:serine/threonine-protein kinase
MLHLNAGRCDEAAAELAHALRISPQSVDAQEMLGRVLVEVGRPEAGIERLELVMALEPRSMQLRYDMARTHALLGDWPQAEALLEERPVEPALMARYWTLRGRLLMWRPDPERVAAYAAEVGSLRFDFQPAIAALAQLLPEGPTGAGNTAVVELIQSRGRRTTTAVRARAFFYQLAAEVAAYRGDRASAVGSLEHADALGLVDLVWLDRCPLFDRLRDDPGLIAVRERVAARAERVLVGLGMGG